MATAVPDDDNHSSGDQHVSKGIQSVISNMASADTVDRKRPRPDDEESRKRGRRMMGVLLGTLNQFRKETMADHGALEKQKQIQSRLAERMQEERVLLAASLEREREAKRLAILESERRWQEQVNEELEAGKRERRRQFANFLQTKTEFPLYYLPGILTEVQQETIDKQISDASK